MAHSPQHPADIPRRPIQDLVAPIERFLHVEAAGGVVLLLATIVAMVMANSALSAAFLGFWKTEVGFRIGGFEAFHSLKHWINDGLMALFFFTIGLEVKRELVLGELKDPRRAAMPVAAALGGMVVPAALYLMLQAGEPGARGWGIPMATDIAFVVGCLAVLGSRVPRGLRVMLLSLAIVDDIGAILVIAIGYTESIGITALTAAFLGLAGVWVLQKLGVRSVPLYAVIGIGIWFAFHESGIHATIAGVILGLMTPSGPFLGRGPLSRAVFSAGRFFEGEGWDRAHDRDVMLREMELYARESVSPLHRLEKLLHPWTSFVIMPLFALANAGIPLDSASPTHPVAVAVIAGLVVGKPVGVFVFSWICARLRIGALPEGVGWGAVFGGGLLSGIGFTMAMFIAGLAVAEPMLSAAKMGVLCASAAAAVLGCIVLLMTTRRPLAG